MLCRPHEVQPPPPPPIQQLPHNQSSDSGTSQQEPPKTVAFVELLRRKNEPLGLVLKGT